MLNIDGIGETQVSSIKSFFSNEANIKVLNELEKILLIKVLSEFDMINKNYFKYFYLSI